MTLKDLEARIKALEKRLDARDLKDSLAPRTFECSCMSCHESRQREVSGPPAYWKFRAAGE